MVNASPTFPENALRQRRTNCYPGGPGLSHCYVAFYKLGRFSMFHILSLRMALIVISFFLLQNMSEYKMFHITYHGTKLTYRGIKLVTMHSNSKKIHHVFPMGPCVLWHGSLRISDVDAWVVNLENEARILTLLLSITYSFLNLDNFV